MNEGAECAYHLTVQPIGEIEVLGHVKPARLHGVVMVIVEATNLVIHEVRDAFLRHDGGAHCYGSATCHSRNTLKTLTRRRACNEAVLCAST